LEKFIQKRRKKGKKYDFLSHTRIDYGRTLLLLLDAEDATMRTVVEVAAEIIFIYFIYICICESAEYEERERELNFFFLHRKGEKDTRPRLMIFFR